MSKSALMRGTVLEHEGTKLLVAGAIGKDFNSLSALVRTIVQTNSNTRPTYYADDGEYTMVQLELEWYDNKLTLNLNYRRDDHIDISQAVIDYFKGQVLSGTMTRKQVKEFFNKYDVDGYTF